jgi:predicted PurR-regulated permease PerM
LILLGIALYLTFLILHPFLHTIILAVVLASLFNPLQQRLIRLYKGRRSLASLTVVLVIIFLIVIPATIFISSLATQGVQSITRVTDWLVAGNLQRLMEDPKIQSYTLWASERFSFIKLEKLDLPGNIMQASKNIGQFLISRGAVLVGGVADVVFHFFVMVFISFYLVRDGRGMVEQIKYLSPLREDQEDRILNKIRLVVRSVLLGTLLTAIVQGIIGGIGLAIVGIPALFWGTVMGLASLIPIVGTGLVWVPAVIYLLLIGSIKSGIFLTLWCVFVVGTIDNFARPYFMKGEGSLSPFYVFLAIIGGVKYFGLIGILYGPLILSFAMVVLYIYSVEYKDLLEGDGIPPAPPAGDEPITPVV